ncbi:MAG: ComEC/Rec2 family competence protein [Alphaproteobacteria bacterium]|nr:ComEC/Rec2 family competence protein [Alphaproteobacteria bacterium]
MDSGHFKGQSAALLLRRDEIISARFWRDALAVTLAAERERWALWTPVFFGMGIAVYFALPVETPLIGLVVGTGIAGLLVLLTHWMGAARLAGVFIFPLFAILGLTFVTWTTNRVAAPILERVQVYPGMSGLVTEVETFPDGARIRLESLDLGWRGRGRPTPEAVRVKLRSGAYPRIGDRVSLMARLSPPPRPSYPGAYDFARIAWFDRLGAVGFSLSDWKTVPRISNTGWWEVGLIAIEQMRMDISRGLKSALPGIQGGVMAALLTGDRAAVPEPVLEDLRQSGLAHLLAISGLHIGMVALIVFATLRLLMALRESWARDYPIKKWAAFGAMVASFGYLLLSGATVPTQRAFLMTGIVLVAVLTDRQAISMRLVAFAAMVVLLIAPDGLIGPSFQLSFAAVIALVAVYESYRFGAGERERVRGWVSKIGFYMAAVCLTTLIAGTATAPFAIHHFGRIAHYSVLANLLAIPIVTFWVMPLGLLSLLAMPLGLEAWPMTAAGYGIETVLQIAHWVATLPGAIGQLPPMTGWGLTCVTLGGLWVAIWRQRWRFLGVPFVLAGLTSPLTQPIPLVLLHETTDQAAIVWQGKLWVESTRRDKFTLSVWAEKTALPIGGNWKDLMALRETPLHCDPLGCILNIQLQDGRAGTIAFTRDPRAVAEDCLFADVTRLPIVPHPSLCRERPAITPADLYRQGVHVIYDGQPHLVVKTVEAARGHRPWTKAGIESSRDTD